MEPSKYWVDPNTMRKAMRRWATGVTVVTSTFEGVSHGMTVSSFTSIDIEPPIVLVSLEISSRTHRLVVNSGVFGVSILADHQQAISDRFAGRIPDDEDRLEGMPTITLETGVPLISGGLAVLDCKVASAVDAGYHTLFIGEVLSVRLGAATTPLIYYERGYHLLKPGS